MWNLKKKKNDTNELTYKTKTDSLILRMSLQLPGVRKGRNDSQGIQDGHVHTAIFKMDNQ